MAGGLRRNNGNRNKQRKQDHVRKGLFSRVGGKVMNRVRAFVEEDPRSSVLRCPTSVQSSGPRVTNAVLNSLQMLEVDIIHFSGLSMRRGGISAALVACVPEPILFLQSGHSFNSAARNYMVPRNLHILFETYSAFGI